VATQVFGFTCGDFSASSPQSLILTTQRLTQFLGTVIRHNPRHFSTR
jgi:hypothetical protein